MFEVSNEGGTDKPSFFSSSEEMRYPMYVIEKSFKFEAAHHLNGLPECHKCARPHGHSYTVTFELSAPELDATGFVTDFAHLDPVGAYIDTTLDHSYLNELSATVTGDKAARPLLSQPSSEHLAHHLYETAVRILSPELASMITAVRVSETASSRATYFPTKRSP
ncbi:MAG: 6-pyruvoyl trahydropterin synthase family protein [Pseudonocardiaceae bacterium]